MERLEVGVSVRRKPEELVNLVEGALRIGSQLLERQHVQLAAGEERQPPLEAFHGGASSAPAVVPYTAEDVYAGGYQYAAPVPR